MEYNSENNVLIATGSTWRKTLTACLLHVCKCVCVCVCVYVCVCVRVCVCVYTFTCVSLYGTAQTLNCCPSAPAHCGVPQATLVPTMHCSHVDIFRHREITAAMPSTTVFYLFSISILRHFLFLCLCYLQLKLFFPHLRYALIIVHTYFLTVLICVCRI